VPSSSARRWEIDAAPAFLGWRDDSWVAVGKMTTFAQAVHRTIVAEGWWRSSLAEIAPRLPRVLRDCDSLTFDTDAEVRAYAALHLADRYGRVLQVLEYISSPSAAFSCARSSSSSPIPAWSGPLIFRRSPAMLGRRGTGSGLWR